MAATDRTTLPAASWRIVLRATSSPLLSGGFSSQRREAGGGALLAHHDVGLFLSAAFDSDGVLEAGDALHRHETSALNGRLDVVAREDFSLGFRTAEVELGAFLGSLDRARLVLLEHLGLAGTTR